MQAIVVTFEASNSLDALRKSLDVPTECPICCTRFTNATTTPCGHVFCRNCLVRSLDHQRACPFCRDSLESCPPPTHILVDILSQLYSHDDETDDALGLDPNFESEHRVPLLIGSLAFPHVNCSIHIFEPRYRLMLRRIMASSRRRFAMSLARRRRIETDAPFHEYGTILELMHVQTLPDGRSIVEAVGSHRFRVTNFEMVDGYHMADIERVDDVDREQETSLEQQQILRASAARIRQQQQARMQEQQQQQQQQSAPSHPAVARPGSMMMARPMAASMARPMAASMARPMAASMARPMAASMARPMAASMARPMSASMARPISASMARPMSASVRPSSAAQRAPSQPQMIGVRRSWAQQAHPQTQPQASRAPWLQMHVQGLSAARPKPHMAAPQQQQQQQQQQPTPTMPIAIPEKVVKNRQEQSTDELLNELATFVEKLMKHKSQNPGDGMSTWLGALGEPPALRGAQRDRVVFTWWLVNLIPLGDDEKLPLLALRTIRERVLLIVSWVDRFEDQWSMFLNGGSLSSSSSTSLSQASASCCIS